MCVSHPNFGRSYMWDPHLINIAVRRCSSTQSYLAISLTVLTTTLDTFYFAIYNLGTFTKPFDTIHIIKNYRSIISVNFW